VLGERPTDPSCVRPSKNRGLSPSDSNVPRQLRATLVPGVRLVIPDPSSSSSSAPAANSTPLAGPGSADGPLRQPESQEPAKRQFGPNQLRTNARPHHGPARSFGQPLAAVTDCVKLARSGFAGRRAILIYGFDDPERSLRWLIEAFEAVAAGHAVLGSRTEAPLRNLVRPVFTRGRFSEAAKSPTERARCVPVSTGVDGRPRSLTEDQANRPRSRHPQVRNGQGHRLPKLIVRVRFSSPAPQGSCRSAPVFRKPQ
jgi:hypothetical protein